MARDPMVPSWADYEENQRKRAAEEKRRGGLSRSMRSLEDLGSSISRNAGDLYDDGVKALKTPINPTFGLGMGAAAAAPLVRNYGVAANGALQRIAQTGSNAYNARLGINPTTGLARQAAVGVQAAPHVPDNLDDLRSMAFDPAVEEATGASGENVNRVKLPQPDFSNVRDSAPNINAAGSGLTRIVKTGDGSYSNMPGAQGEQRYYDALGNRADRAAPSNVTGNTTVAEYNQRQNAGEDLSRSYDGMVAMGAQGAASLASVKGMEESTGLRRQSEFLNSLSAADRAELEAATMKERGLDRRAAAQITSAETIAAGTQGLNAAKTQLEQQNRLDDLYMKDPVAATSLTFSKLRNKSPAEMDKFFESEEGSQMIDFATRKLREEGGSPIYNLLAQFGVVKPAAQLNPEDLGAGTFSQYNVKGSELVGPGFSGDELGLPADAFREISNFRKRRLGQLAR